MKVSVLSELNELLPKRSRNKELEVSYQGRQSIKHIIESLGIPHTEIGLLTNRGQSVEFNYLVQPGDVILVYPATPKVDSYSGLFTDGKLTLEPRFLLDNHLGKLATYLRILGLDAMYRNDFQDDELVLITVDLNRILLTRDRQLLMRKMIRFGYLIRSLEPEKQVIEILRRFDLTEHIIPFHRCLRCNTQLEPVQKKSIVHRLQPKTKKYFQVFHICPLCQRIYWKGSHYEHMDLLITDMLNVPEDDQELRD